MEGWFLKKIKECGERGCEVSLRGDVWRMHVVTGFR